MDSGTSETRLGSPASHPVDIVGFAPGTMLADRYRIVAMVGRGGMGEVYRADDLRLGQPVALKFLPPGLEHDPAARDRLLAEVRHARLVSHPNVCRVFDVGELQGRCFLTMEYIDGENVASLLRRIGRLPGAKALEIARQLCAGLAAAHERGVLHRDLKPANVMIDGRGHARITDFGLAVELEARPRAEARSSPSGAKAGGLQVAEVAGTVAYLAPERFEGKPATVQSDLYALGLVLYEIYTGKQAVSATTIEGWRLAHSDSTPGAPSRLVSEIEPAVERAILRCLEKDPAKRPGSAAQLATALPGGDPLAAAIAAGETPSPELVAASGQEGTLPRGTAWRWLAACLLALAVAAGSWTAVSLPNLMPFAEDPGILQKTAREILAEQGYNRPVADSAWRIRRDAAFVDWATRAQAPLAFEEIARTAPGPLIFCYRQAPGPFRLPPILATATPFDVALKAPGDSYVELDLRGRLVQLSVVPEESDRSTHSTAPDWGLLFKAAGLDRLAFTPVEPASWPEHPFDVREAWEGQYGPYKFRVEAAARGGRAVSFRLVAPWSSVHAPLGDIARPASRAWDLVTLLAGWISLIVLLVLARRNARLGRGDHRGAFRLALAVGVTVAGVRVLSAHWALASPSTLLWSLLEALVVAGGMALIAWVAYLGFEPDVRRRWPHLLVGWTRLLDGRWRDPLVGRSVLVGVLAGCVWAFPLSVLLPLISGLPGAAPHYYDGSLDAPGPFISARLGTALLVPLLYTFISVAVTVLARLILRRTGPAFAILGLLLFTDIALQLRMGRPTAENTVVLLVAAAIFGGLLVGTLWRSGVLAFTLAWVICAVLEGTPWTADVGRWYAWRSGFAIAVVLTLAVWGFRNVLGQQSAFPAALDD